MSAHHGAGAVNSENRDVLEKSGMLSVLKFLLVGSAATFALLVMLVSESTQGDKYVKTSGEYRNTL
jgi:hypothetical protein